MVNMLFMAYDGDDAGKLVGRAVLANDVAGLHEVSRRIATGHEVVQLWVEQNGGQVISGGGDEGTFQIPAGALEGIEQLRADYQFATQLTMTVGVGASLSEAGKSLMAGKFRGKNQVVQYDPSVDQELAAAQAHVQQGQGTEEEKKISEAYLAPAKTEPHCQYCAEVEHEHIDDDCQYCKEADAKTAPAADHEHTDDCQYCAEADAKAAAPMDHEHSDNCQYCAEADAKAAAPTHDHLGDDCQYCAEASAAAAPMAASADPLAGVPSPEAAVAADTNMEGGISRPAGYGQDDGTPTDATPGDDLFNDGAPDLAEVLQGGLDQHQDQIAKERAINMIGQALVGFKNQKHILERAQQAAPELYQSTIMMLKAMIEMGKMLGLQPKQPEAQAEAQQIEQAAPAPAGQPAAAQGDAAQSPQQ